MRILKHIVSLDGHYFEFLQDDLKSLGKNICENFKEKIAKNFFVYGLVDVLLKKIVYGFSSVNIYVHLAATKCDVCTSFYVDDNILGARIDWYL